MAALVVNVVQISRTTNSKSQNFRGTSNPGCWDWDPSWRLLWEKFLKDAMVCFNFSGDMSPRFQFALARKICDQAV